MLGTSRATAEAHYAKYFDTDLGAQLKRVSC